MIALIQRVSSAKVEINSSRVAEIERGIMALVAVQASDTSDTIQRTLKRILNYRIFPDEAGKMNLSLTDVQGGLILVPQFTLLADTKRGNRASFSHNVPAEVGEKLFKQLLSFARQEYPNTQHGEFGADMQVSLCNDGPVTFWLEI